MAVSLAQRAESLRAYRRAFSCIKPGDRVTVGRCGGGRATFEFAGWSGFWMVGKSGRDDYAPSAIVTLNGERVSFLDPPWERIDYDPDTGRPYGDHGTYEQALDWALDAGDRVREVDDLEEFLIAWRRGEAWRHWPEFYRWRDPYPVTGAGRLRTQLAKHDAADPDSACPH